MIIIIQSLNKDVNQSMNCQFIHCLYCENRLLSLLLLLLGEEKKQLMRKKYKEELLSVYYTDFYLRYTDDVL